MDPAAAALAGKKALGMAQEGLITRTRSPPST